MSIRGFLRLLRPAGSRLWKHYACGVRGSYFCHAAFEMFEVQFSIFFLVVSGFLKYGSYLFITFLFGLVSEERVSVAGLRFTYECS